MMIRQLLLAPAILIAPALFGQQEQINPAGVFQRNEVGVNTGPLLLPMLGSDEAIQSPVVTYKRRLSDKLAFRISAGAHPMRKIYNFNEWTRFETVDSMRHSQSQKYRGTNFLLRTGFEYRKTIARNASFVFAGEMQLMYSNIHGTITGRLPSDSLQEIDQKEAKYDRLSKSVQQDSYITGLRYGLGLSAGMIIELGDGFLLSPEFRLDAFDGTLKTAVTNNYSGVSTTSYTSVFKFYTGTPMTEVHLYYRF